MRTDQTLSYKLPHRLLKRIITKGEDLGRVNHPDREYLLGILP